MYKLIAEYGNTICIKRLEDNAFIPLALDNTDYQAFTQWINDGNIPLPADEGENNGEVIK